MVNPVLNHPYGAYCGHKKYDPAIVPFIAEMYEGGRTDCEIAADIGIAENTFYEWCNKYPEFKAAVQIGKAKAKKWMIEKGRELATERSQYKADAKIWHILMRNCHGFDKEEKDVATKQDLQATTEKMAELIKQHAKDY